MHTLTTYRYKKHVNNEKNSVLFIHVTRSHIQQAMKYYNGLHYPHRWERAIITLA